MPNQYFKTSALNSAWFLVGLLFTGACLYLASVMFFTVPVRTVAPWPSQAFLERVAIAGGHAAEITTEGK